MAHAEPGTNFLGRQVLGLWCRGRQILRQNKLNVWKVITSPEITEAEDSACLQEAS